MNIAEILYECPSDTKLYSSTFGELSLLYVLPCSLYPIYCKVIRSGSTVSFTEDGKRNITDAEPTLFPSKEQRDWSEFGVTDQKQKHELKPFDKVLVRDGDLDVWNCNIFNRIYEDGEYQCIYQCIDYEYWKQCIPYVGNEHLLGTTNKPEVNNETN